MLELHFLRPILFLALLVLLPLASMLWYVGFQLRRKARKAYGEERLVNRFSQPLRLASEVGVLAAWLVTLVALVVAAAGPVVPDAPQHIQEGSLQVVVVTDVSRSMAAEDYRNLMPPKKGVAAPLVPGPYGTRLDMIKHVIKTQIMPAIAGNQIGISTYCGNGFDQADLTTDFEAVRWVMDNWMKIGAAPGGGSDYAEGLKEALRIFDLTPDAKKQKVIVLFSDGGFTGDRNELAKVISEIQKRSIRVIIVGVGGNAPLPIPMYNETTGQLTGYLQKNGQVVTTAIDEASLNALASQMGASYIRLDPNRSLDIQWASTLSGSHAEKHEAQVYRYPLGVAMFLLFVLFVRGILPGYNRQRV